MVEGYLILPLVDTPLNKFIITKTIPETAKVNIYLFKVNDRKTRKRSEYVQS